MSTSTIRKLLLLHAASQHTQTAHDALVDSNPELAIVLRQAGEQIAWAVGMLVKAEADRAAGAVQL